MDTQIAGKVRANLESDHPSPYRNRNLSRESYNAYSSDDEALEDRDLSVLDTDYVAQRNLSFFPIQHQPNARYDPTIPPSLQQSRDPRVNPQITSSERTMYHPNHDYRLPQYNAQAYQEHRRRRPLIDLIKNEWQNNPYTSLDSSPSPEFLSPRLKQILSAPRPRRYVLTLVAFVVLFWVNWHIWVKASFEEHRLLNESLQERMKTGGGWFGANLRPEFMDMIHIKTLDQGLIPQKDNERRLVVVGDVHGCHEELVNLLAEVQYEARTDHLVLAGDFISKGPSSPAVVDLAMSAHASCVRGNHEDRILLAYRDMYSHRLTPEQISSKIPHPPMAGMPENMSQNEPLEDTNVEGGFAHGDAADKEQAKMFSKPQMDYMIECPVILNVGQVEGMGDVHVVHAGLVPSVPLDRQDPMSVMSMRTVDLETHVPSGSSKGAPWYKLWNRYQTMIPAHQRSTVIYGHDSRRSLELHEHTKGLDSGCVNGGKLTALIIDKKVQEGEPRTVSVQCKDYSKVKMRES